MDNPKKGKRRVFVLHSMEWIEFMSYLQLKWDNTRKSFYLEIHDNPILYRSYHTCRWSVAPFTDMV